MQEMTLPAATGLISTGLSGLVITPSTSLQHASAATAISTLYVGLTTDFSQLQAPIVLRIAAPPMATAEALAPTAPIAAAPTAPSKLLRNASLAGLGGSFPVERFGLVQTTNSIGDPARRDDHGLGITVSTGLTVGYVIWMLRGGMLISSLIAQMPAWRLVDPLVVLDRFEEFDSSDDENDESLRSILETAGQVVRRQTR